MAACACLLGYKLHLGKLYFLRGEKLRCHSGRATIAGCVRCGPLGTIIQCMYSNLTKSLDKHFIECRHAFYKLHSHRGEKLRCHGGRATIAECVRCRLLGIVIKYVTGSYNAARVSELSQLTGIKAVRHNKISIPCCITHTARMRPL